MDNIKCAKIEFLLSEYLKKMSNDDYLKLINNCPELKKYDEIMAKIDNGDYPTNYLKNITDFELNKIIKYLEK